MNVIDIKNLKRDVDVFTKGYIVAALWSSTDDEGDPLDDNYNWTHLAIETLAKMVSDCEKFQEQNQSTLLACGLDGERCGHDFWLTRNHHGSGFWDENTQHDPALKDALDALTDAAHGFGECNLYVGDDGKIYL